MQQPPVPIVTLVDWLTVFGPLTTGIVIYLSILKLVAPKKGAGKVLTFTNVWLTLSGIIHSWIELDFVFSRETSIIKPTLDMYAAGDFRYGIPLESGTAAMEAITAILEGPMCLAVVFAAVMNRSWRHPMQLILTTMQIYGLVWFAIHPYFTEEGYSGHFSADPILCWLVAFGANAPWGIFPPILWYKSFSAICKGMGKYLETEKKQK